MSMIKSEQKEKIEVFLKYIYRNNISITVDMNVENQNKSICEFIKLLKEKAGDELSCVFDKRNNKILILDENNKSYIGFLWGIVDIAFSRGDARNSPLYIKYAVIKSEVYIGGEKVAYIDSSDQIYYRGDEEGIYVIDKITKSLMNFKGDRQIWKTEIPVNITQSYKICEQLSYPTEKYPKGLIALYNGYDLLHFYRVSGEYFGRTLVKWRFEISQK